MACVPLPTRELAILRQQVVEDLEAIFAFIFTTVENNGLGEVIEGRIIGLAQIYIEIVTHLLKLSFLGIVPLSNTTMADRWETQKHIFFESANVVSAALGESGLDLHAGWTLEALPGCLVLQDVEITCPSCGIVIPSSYRVRVSRPDPNRTSSRALTAHIRAQIIPQCGGSMNTCSSCRAPLKPELYPEASTDCAGGTMRTRISWGRNCSQEIENAISEGVNKLSNVLNIVTVLAQAEPFVDDEIPDLAQRMIGVAILILISFMSGTWKRSGLMLKRVDCASDFERVTQFVRRAAEQIESTPRPC